MHQVSVPWASGSKNSDVLSLAVYNLPLLETFCGAAPGLPGGCSNLCLCPGFLLALPGPTGGPGFSLAGDAEPYWGRPARLVQRPST